MHILIATDAFPPVCGGSGWSTYELAKGLQGRGHEVTIVRPRVGRVPSEGTAYDGFQPLEIPVWAPPLPYARNYFKNERLYGHLRIALRDLVRTRRIDLLHAQHVLTGPPGIAAAHASGIPAVCTVRDYWPVCYWSDLIYDRGAESLCPECSVAGMMRCVQPRAGALWPLALPMIPYMRANLSMKRRTLAEADAVVAVSSAIARDLRARAPELANTRIETIHNPVDIPGIREQAENGPRPLGAPYAIFVGKLEANKGVSKLLVALERSRLDWPLVVVGDGAERATLELAARRAGLRLQVTGWLPRGEALRWLHHAHMLVFPSHGPESLSRVLLEASALGTPIAAMDTGGTGDIVVDGETGLLSHSAEQLGDAVARLRNDAQLRARLGAAAKQRAEQIFSADVSVAKLERLYGELARTRHS